MRKAFTILLFVFLSTSPSIAIQGDCSWHEGIDCSAGADWDGSVICNDGWRDSKDAYHDAEMCRDKTSLLARIMKVCDITKITLEEWEEIKAPTASAQSALNTINLALESLKTLNQRIAVKALRGEDTRQLQAQSDAIWRTTEEAKATYEASGFGADNLAIKIAANYCREYDTSYDAGFEEAIPLGTKQDSFGEDAGKSQFKDSIIALKNRGVVSGYDDGTFKPFNPINRAEFMKIIIGAVEIEPTGKNCFSDINEEWFAPYVCAGMTNGIVDGYSDGSFKPDQQINVAEALKITLKAFGIQTREANNGEAWYAPFVENAHNNGYYLSTFNNDSKQLTREDMAELVYRIIENN